MDPEPKKEILVSFLKVVLAFKRIRFGRPWPGTVRLQAVSLWFDSSWMGLSSSGVALLRSNIQIWYSWVKDPSVLKREDGRYNGVSINSINVFTFQDGMKVIRKQERRERTKYFYSIVTELDDELPLQGHRVLGILDGRRQMYRRRLCPFLLGAFDEFCLSQLGDRAMEVYSGEVFEVDEAAAVIYRGREAAGEHGQGGQASQGGPQGGAVQRYFVIISHLVSEFTILVNVGGSFTSSFFH